MPFHRTDAATPDARARAFVRRVYPMRMLGVALLALPYASVLQERGAGALAWAALALNLLVWPHLAFLWAYRSRDPARAERRNLVLDAVFGGAWVAMSQVSLVPAAALVSILAADRLAAGGWRLLWRAGAGFAVAFLACWLLAGRPFDPLPSQRTLLLSLPPIFVYMLALSSVTYRQARHIVQQNRELDRVNRTDPGLDIPNRRFFAQRALHLLDQVHRHGGAASLLLVDVDRFKAINDGHGHGVGDEVLRQIARVLREQARDSDGFPARIGGDEFALLLPCDGAAAAAVTAALCTLVAQLQIPGAPGLVPSISVGLAELAPEHRGLDDWMGAADRAMYVVKAATHRQD